MIKCFKLESLVLSTNDNGTDRDIILQQLNAYELVSLGIRRGLFDESFYKRWYHNQFTKDYQSTQGFILKAREEKQKQSIYCEYTALYEKWSKHGHPDHSPNRFKMAWWGLMKNTIKIDAARENSKPR